LGVKERIEVETHKLLAFGLSNRISPQQLGQLRAKRRRSRLKGDVPAPIYLIVQCKGHIPLLELFNKFAGRTASIMESLGLRSQRAHK
jgi:hypothetical protein